jgi:hypothetical protein
MRDARGSRFILRKVNLRGDRRAAENISFDVGEDTGTPVVEDYAGKMPFPFTGTLKKFVVVLEPEKLTEEERRRLLEEEATASMAVQ